MDFDDWIEAVDELATQRLGQPISPALTSDRWLTYYRDGMTPADVCRSLEDG